MSNYDAIPCKCPECGADAYNHRTDYGSHVDEWVECSVIRCQSGRQEEEDLEWKREIAMEAGMLGGCGAYNEVMGY